MANPNKAVARAAARRPFDPARQAAQDAARAARADPAITWMWAQMGAGRCFQSVEEAREAYEREAKACRTAAEQEARP